MEDTNMNAQGEFCLIPPSQAEYFDLAWKAEATEEEKNLRAARIEELLAMPVEAFERGEHGRRLEILRCR